MKKKEVLFVIAACVIGLVVGVIVYYWILSNPTEPQSIEDYVVEAVLDYDNVESAKSMGVLMGLISVAGSLAIMGTIEEEKQRKMTRK